MHTCGCHRLCDNRVYQIWRTKFSLSHWLYTQKQKQMTEKSSALHKNQRRGRDWLRCILHRLTPIPSARRRGPSKACEAISYCVAPFCFPHLCLQANLSHRCKKQKDVFRHLLASYSLRRGRLQNLWNHRKSQNFNSL